MSARIPISLLYGHIEIHELPVRIEPDGTRVMRSRHVGYDGAGNVTEDRIYEGARYRWEPAEARPWWRFW